MNFSLLKQRVERPGKNIIAIRRNSLYFTNGINDNDNGVFSIIKITYSILVLVE